MSDKAQPHIYSISPEKGFIDTLAAGLLQQTENQPENLSHYRIFLPTRRACRTLRESFLKLTNGKPLLLPQMSPLGDIDETELMIKLPEVQALDIPPAISSLQRQILLSRTIQAIPDFKAGADQAMALAKALGQFMDQIIIEGLSLDILHTVVPEDFADHWQITIDFLKILSENWPAILNENGVIDAADRRNRLVNALSRHLTNSRPATPIIAAGSTGTVPATRALMNVIAGLPKGSVILPGLDREIDTQSWEALDDAHPQHSLKVLLESFDMEPGDVPEWPYASENVRHSRTRLLGEIMRPAETTHLWTRIQVSNIGKPLEGLEYYALDTPQDEAMLIALILRETLESEAKTAALVTPDRALARRVSLICKRWGIVLDDSGGRPLSETRRGSFFALCLNAVLEDCRPVALLALLKHGLFTLPGFDTGALTRTVSGLDRNHLRGIVAYNNFADIIDQKPDLPEQDQSFLLAMDDLFAPIRALKQNGYVPFQDLLKSHILLAEQISTGKGDTQTLWMEDDGEALSSLLSELLNYAHLFPNMPLGIYADILAGLMQQATVRPSYGTHPRLMILGQLEARMVQSDVMILSGLNEGSWPPDIGHDPWMSRPMRKNYGLPSMDMRIGLSAHDFSQCFSAPRVVMTRSRRSDNAPSVPSRWIQRLETVLKSVDITLDDLAKGPYESWVQAIQDCGEPEPYKRPAPAPPAGKRPKKLPVTAIESWMRDPYALYAKYVLKLRKLDDLEGDMDAAMRGSLIHDIFDRFITDYPDDIPDNGADILMDYAVEALGQPKEHTDFWLFWEPRLKRMIDWFITHETEWRDGASPKRTEAEGAYTFDDLAFTLHAKADRIDMLNDNKVAIIDYKTGQPPSMTDIRAGLAPQLPLEAVILKHQGFEGIASNDIGYLGFWRMSGASDAGEEITIKAKKDETLDDLADAAEHGLHALITAFDNDNTPYMSLPRPAMAPRASFQDYAHLARVQEWAALDDSEGSA